MPSNLTAAAIKALNEALRVKFHSLARYVLSANPYATPADLPVVEALERIASDDEAQAREITAQIEALDGIPFVGLPDPLVAEIAYLAIPRLARQCLEWKRQQAARIQQSLEALSVSGEPDAPVLISAKTLLQRLAQTDLKQAETLENTLGATVGRQMC